MNDDNRKEVTGRLITSESKIRWRIEHFSSKMNLPVGSSLYSPYFNVFLSDSSSTKWRLKLYPGGEDEKSIEYLSLYLQYCGEIPVEVESSLSVWNENTKTVFEKQSMTVDEFSVICNSWGYKDFLKKKIIMDGSQNVLADDVLTILCQISISDGLNNDDDEIISVNNYHEKLLENGKFSDVVAVIGNKRVSLHKIMLTSISPVFQAMFDHNMKENSESKIRITDIKYNIAIEMFRYIYCRRVNNIKDIAGDLLKAADKYAIAGLKNLCEQTIVKDLSVDNVPMNLLLVTTYETAIVESKLTKFIAEHLNEIIDKPEYKQLNKECMDFIIRAVAKKMQ